MVSRKKHSPISSIGEVELSETGRFIGEGHLQKDNGIAEGWRGKVAEQGDAA